MAGPGHGVDPCEVARLAEIGAQPLLHLLHHLVAVAPVQLGPILGELGDGGLCRVPVPGAVLVQVRRGAGEPPERIAEDGW